MRCGSFSDLRQIGNKHRRLSRLKAVLWGLLALPEPSAPQVTGIREVTSSPSRWQETVAVGTVAVALAGCLAGRDREAIAGGAQALGVSMGLGIRPAPKRSRLSPTGSIKEGWTFY